MNQSLMLFEDLFSILDTVRLYSMYGFPHRGIKEPGWIRLMRSQRRLVGRQERSPAGCQPAAWNTLISLFCLIEIYP